ncbi:hypothetical protein BpHYR1_049282 [Brachionus plicatilis]|uniref:Uncharacterized protein n=1 Tax=Brachionus plicatilis TaxID=10195 RepID=A0A3M7RZT9_BRAPC|nr:hypothetical protein BpHYR1_049282 [Brachionus plicatilis]
MLWHKLFALQLKFIRQKNPSCIKEDFLISFKILLFHFLDLTVNVDKKFINWSKLCLIHDIWNYTRGSIFYNRIDLEKNTNTFYR